MTLYGLALVSSQVKWAEAHYNHRRGHEIEKSVDRKSERDLPSQN